MIQIWVVLVLSSWSILSDKRELNYDIGMFYGLGF